MTAGARRRAIAPLVLTMVLFAVFMTVLGRVADDPDFDIGVESAAFVVAIALWAVLQASVGTVIVWRRPRNRIGRIMQVSGPLLILVFLDYSIGAWRYVTHGPEDLLGGLAAWWASSTILLTVFIALPLLGLLFPDGRLPSPRYAWPLRAVGAGLIGPTLLYALAAGPVDADLRLRHQLDLPMLSDELRRATIQTVEPRATAVWLRPRGSRSWFEPPSRRCAATVAIRRAMRLGSSPSP